MLVYERASYGKKGKQNTFAIMVLASLGWWCFCDVFFFVAPTAESAWFWHRLGAPGWCGFIACTAYYFFVMTGFDEKMSRPFKVAFWAVAIALTVRFMAAAPSGIADGMVLCPNGLGWTFSQSFTTPWPYLFLLYLLVYMGGSLLYLHRWQKSVANRITRRLARGFVILDCVSVALGFISLYVVPQITDEIPPLGFAATMVFGLWYWTHLRNFDFTFVEFALNPSYVYENCIDGLVVADEDNLVLYANSEARRVLGADDLEGRPFVEYVGPEYRGIRGLFERVQGETPTRFNFVSKSDVPVMCSVTRTKAQGGNSDVFVVRLSDVTQMRRAQEDLEHLAYHDAMTGLHNRRYLDDALDSWVSAAVSGQDFELLFIDVTGFKQVNDVYGHAVGDDALVAIGRALEGAIGEQGEVVRYAGDEFVALARADSDAGLVDALREAVSRIDSVAIAAGLRLGVDIGSCRYSEAGSTEALLRIADERMYARKSMR